jgi:hypothetical protein
MVFASEETAQQWSGACTLNDASSRPLSRSHTLSVLSVDAETMIGLTWEGGINRLPVLTNEYLYAPRSAALMLQPAERRSLPRICYSSWPVSQL